MSRRDNFFIIIKYHYNPTTSDVGKGRPLPVLMLDSNEDPLEFDTRDSAEEFVNICNINSNQGFGYEAKEIGKKWLKVTQKQLLKG